MPSKKSFRSLNVSSVYYCNNTFPGCASEFDNFTFNDLQIVKDKLHHAVRSLIFFSIVISELEDV